jgi:hypothetical protein
MDDKLQTPENKLPEKEAQLSAQESERLARRAAIKRIAYLGISGIAAPFLMNAACEPYYDYSDYYDYYNYYSNYYSDSYYYYDYYSVYSVYWDYKK